jgi:2-ketocyclohexanecarboxyl-CoA hydrolase
VALPIVEWCGCSCEQEQPQKESEPKRRSSPAAQLMDEARAWAHEMLAMSPTALRIAKVSFNAETDHVKGIGALGMTALGLYYGTEESMEGRNAFMERRKPDFGKYRK